MVDWQFDLGRVFRCKLQNCTGFVEHLVLNQTSPNRRSECFQKCVCHRPSDKNRVYTTAEISQCDQFVGDLCAANDRDERFCRRIHNSFEITNFSLEQFSCNARMTLRSKRHRQCEHRRIRSMRCAKRIIAICVRVLRKRCSENGVAFFLPLLKSKVFQEQRFAWL